MQMIAPEQLKRDIVNAFEKIVECSFESTAGSDCKFCNDVGRITDVTPSDDAHDSYSFGMSIVADGVKYGVCIRPGAVARYGRLHLQNFDGDASSMINCGDPRVLYLYWRMCIEDWRDGHAIDRAMKKHLREHPDDSTRTTELWRQLSNDFTPKRHARLRAAIPTMEDAISWLASQGLAFACRPADEYWEMHFYPWWKLVTEGKIK